MFFKTTLKSSGVLIFSLLRSLQCFGPELQFDAVSNHEALFIGDQAVSVYSVNRIDLSPFLDDTTSAGFSRLRRMYRDRAETNILLHNMSRAITSTYIDRGLVKRSNSRGLELLRKYSQGSSKLLGIAHFGDIYTFYETAGATPEYLTPQGVPITSLEQRLVPMGMKPLSRSEPSLVKTKIKFIHPTGELNYIQEVEDFLAKVERWVGGYVVLNGLARPDEFHPEIRDPLRRMDYADAVLKLMIRYELPLWTEVTVPYPAPPLSEKLAQEAAALKSKYPFISDELLYPNLQKYVIADKVLVHTVNPATARAYELTLGFGQPFDTLYDLDFERQAYVSVSSRENFETKASEMLSQRESSPILRIANLEQSSLPLLSCSMALDIRSLPSLRIPGNYEAGLILVDIRKLVVPKWSPLSRIAR